MNEKHLSYFKVENFKRFESFEMHDIGQFNLILGDNNVGKTSVLEALLFDLEDAKRFRDNLLTVLYEFRKIEIDTENPLSLLVKAEEFALCVSYKNKKHRLEIPVRVLGDNYFGINYKYSSNNRVEDINFIQLQSKLPYDRQEGKENIPYIPFHVGYDEDLTNYYSRHIQKTPSLKKRLISALQVLIPSIENIEVSAETGKLPLLLIIQHDRDYAIPLSMFGEGAIKLFRILAKIIVHRGKRLMIDEIDAGIHFKKFKDFWRTILLAAKQNDVQIFATTHNEECLEAFKEVLEETELLSFQEDARSFTLRELPNGQVKSYTYPYQQFKAMLENGNNIRGGSYEK